MELKDEWLTPGGAADWLGVPLDAVHLAIRDGGVPVLTVGGHVRISRGALLALARGGAIANGAVASASEPAELLPNLPAPAGFAWVEQLSPAKGFVHGSPKHGGGYYEEPYPEAWAGMRERSRQRTLEGFLVAELAGGCGLSATEYVRVDPDDVVDAQVDKLVWFVPLHGGALSCQRWRAERRQRPGRAPRGC